MPVTITENVDSREFSLNERSPHERTLTYTVLGTFDELEVEALLLATAPLEYEDLPRETVTAAHQGNGVWFGSARYQDQVITWDPLEYPGVTPTLVDFSFDTGGGSQKITQSIDTLIWDPAGGTPKAPDFGGAIGVGKDTVEGVDIVVPRYEFQETHAFDPLFITQAYKMILFRATGKVNAAAFKGFARGEVLFLGATGSRSGNETWKITYKFACSPNEDSINIGTNFIGVQKLGWEYLWVRYKDTEDTAAYTMVKRPQGVYTEQVYDFHDFSLLGIGVT